ncbi:hypothetical protein ONE63_011013 [Megalurothrips usitatus]|uniref:Uncharacterized protein n=1 Tax=Megalurothrips usitatus TaxID=439358 RepID=A0AAV7XES1_9NEOP|nr:hypothetical protein ONE63_011013 [Megalurothrips usitatus]
MAARTFPASRPRASTLSRRMEGRTTVVIDIDLYVDRTATSFTKLTSNHTTCQDVVSASTCRQRDLFTFNRGVCALIATPMMPWTSFVNSVQPALKCPMKKGFYKARGVAVDMRAASALLRPGDDVGALFIGRGTLFDQDGSPFLCLSVLADLVRVKIRG